MIDVTVMGGGIFGLSIAYACAKRGAKVRLIEKHSIGAGSSGGVVGALAPHVPENWNPKKEFQFQSLIMAQAFWDGVQAASGLSPGYARTGRLQAVADDHALDLAQGRRQTAAELWRGLAEWQVLRAQDRDAWQPLSPTGHLIYDTLSARMHPRMACESLAAAVSALGGEIIIGEGKAEGKVVWATGYEGLADLSDVLGKPVGNGVKGQALCLQHSMPDAPQLFVDGLHIIPHDNGTVAIGSTSERDFDAPDSTDDQVDGLHARAITACPFLRDAPIVTRWAGVRPRARSRAPMLGPWPGRDGHFIANGGFKIGFGMAPKVAEVMADSLLQGRDDIPAGFRPEDNL